MHRVLVFAVTLLIGGCQYLPHIEFDRHDAQATPAPQTTMIPAPEPAPAPPQTIVVPSPQLRPLPAAAPATSPDEHASITAIRQATTKATRSPVPQGFLEATQVYQYVPGVIYQAYTRPGDITSVQLQPGENITDVAAGDTVRWVVSITSLGDNASLTPVVIVKPLEKGLSTNLAITTDRRAYDLELISTDQAYNHRIAWSYPQDISIVPRARGASPSLPATPSRQTIQAGLSLDKLNFGYSIKTTSGNAPRWQPLRAFDDGEKTYIEFPPNLGTMEAPPLFVLGDDQKAEIVNYRPRGNYYVVDRIFDAAEIRLGTSPQTVVRIQRTTATAQQ